MFWPDASASGSLTGAALDEIPANLRFYAGGGGSVRGYQYMSLAPAGPGDSVIGGRSLLDASAELRVKVTDTIGVVPFFDAGNAFASSAPDFKQPLRMAAGLGLRYYTAIGPIRLDVAAPINRRANDPPVPSMSASGRRSDGPPTLRFAISGRRADARVARVRRRHLCARPKKTGACSPI